MESANYRSESNAVLSSWTLLRRLTAAHMLLLIHTGHMIYNKVIILPLIGSLGNMTQTLAQ